MAWKTDTAANGQAAFEDIISELKSTAFMGAGNEWTEIYRQDMLLATNISSEIGRTLTVVLEAPGNDGEGIYIGLAYSKSSTISNTFFVESFTFTDLTVPYPSPATQTFFGTWSSASVSYTAGQIVVRSGTNHYACIQSHTSSTSNDPNSGGGVPYWSLIHNVYGRSTQQGFAAIGSGAYLKSWNGEGSGNTVTYWLFADNKRAICVFKSGTASARYHIWHFGALKRFGTLDENPYPVFLSSNGSATDYTNSNDNNLTSSGAVGGNRTVLYGPDLTACTAQSSNMTFYYNGVESSLRPDPISGDSLILELLFVTSSFSSVTSYGGFAGTPEGLYGVVLPVGWQSEDLVTVGADEYIVFALSSGSLPYLVKKA